jgi:hypothetical protein
MKTIKGAITTLLIIFCYSFSEAQQVSLTPSQWLVEYKKEIGTTPYIFEGTVIQQQKIRWRNRLLECNIMQITKIYKGTPQVKLGTIKVIQWYGETISGDLISISPPSDYVSIVLNKGQTYIILGNPSYSDAVDSVTTTDNQINLTTADYPITIYSNNTVSWYGTTQFKTTDDIYSFFKENGLTVREEIQRGDSAKQK